MKGLVQIDIVWGNIVRDALEWSQEFALSWGEG